MLRMLDHVVLLAVTGVEKTCQESAPGVACCCYTLKIKRRRANNEGKSNSRFGCPWLWRIETSSFLQPSTFCTSVKTMGPSYSNRCRSPRRPLVKTFNSGVICHSTKPSDDSKDRPLCNHIFCERPRRRRVVSS